MAARSRQRTCAGVLVAVAVLVTAACGSTSRPEQVSTAGPLAGESTQPPPTTAASTIGAFAACDDIPDVESIFGPGPAFDSLPSSVFDTVGEYGAKHSDEFGFMWNGAAPGGAIVAAFTGNIEAHRDALEALLPPDTPFDVVKVDHSHASLLELQASIGRLQGMQGIGMANCPDNPDVHAIVELSRPLGDRALLHGALAPPEPIQLRPDP